MYLGPEYSDYDEQDQSLATSNIYLNIYILRSVQFTNRSILEHLPKLYRIESWDLKYVYVLLLLRQVMILFSSAISVVVSSSAHLALDWHMLSMRLFHITLCPPLCNVAAAVTSLQPQC